MLLHDININDHYSSIKCAGVIWTTIIAVIKCNVYVRAIFAAVSPAYICNQPVGGFTSWVLDTPLGNGVLTIYVLFAHELFCYCMLCTSWITPLIPTLLITLIFENEGNVTAFSTMVSVFKNTKCIYSLDKRTLTCDIKNMCCVPRILLPWQRHIQVLD